MENMAIGELGLHVLSRVEGEKQHESALVQTHRRSLGEKHVPAMRKKTKLAIRWNVLYMVCSVSGVHGQNVPSRAGAVLHFAREIVIIQHHNMGEDHVKDHPKKQKHAT
jgi:hypothetical protein